MDNKILTVKIQLDKNNTASEIMELVTEIINETNDKGYAVMEASVAAGMEASVTIFNTEGFLGL